MGEAGTGKRRITLIACRIFEEELNAVLASVLHEMDVDVVWLDAALHCDLRRMENALLTAFAAAKKSGSEVRLLFGQGCHPELNQLAKEHGVRVLPVKNCIEAFLGDRLPELEANHAIVMTPAWIRTLPSSSQNFMGWDAVDMRINLGRYEKILVVDPGLHPLSDEEVLEFFDLVQVPVEVVPLDLDRFRQELISLLA
jgi:hypothetical protein